MISGHKFEAVWAKSSKTQIWETSTLLERYLYVKLKPKHILLIKADIQNRSDWLFWSSEHTYLQLANILFNSIPLYLIDKSNKDYF